MTSTPPAPPVFSLTGVSKTYAMGALQVEALKATDLELYGGELVVLLGASGSGKSTLLNIIGGLDLPSAGTLRYGALDLSRADDAALTRYRRHHVGFVFQFYNLIPSLTALENVQLVTEISDHPMDAAEALDMVGLGGRRTAARGHRAGHRQAARHPAVRRPHRRARLPDRQAGAGSADPHQQ